MKTILFTSLLALILPEAFAKARPMKALIVVTGHSELGSTGKKTGYYLPEVSHPFFALMDEGIEVDIASPKGGLAPMDEKSRDLTDKLNRRMVEEHGEKLAKTLKLSDVNTSKYQAIIFAGGHGTMWDFAQTPSVRIAAEAIYENGGILAAVCHGPAALLNLKDKKGIPLVKGKRVSSFTNDEEEAAGLTKVMPFLLETEFIKLGAKFEKAELWQKKVIVDGRLVTGQNPASAEGVGQETARLMKSL
ncbi:MAG: type 1 glutamine amidotransferase domain-containing protein [Bdellovibrionota bacterium]